MPPLPEKMGEALPPLETQCLRFCQALTSKSHVFTFNLTLASGFSLSLDTRGTATTTVVLKKRKKASPSTLRRNLKRKQEFLKQKGAPEETDANTDLETPSQEDHCFKCNLGENSFQTGNGLKIHRGKAHKKLGPPQTEKLRESAEPSLSLSPEKKTERGEEHGETDEEKEGVKEEPFPLLSYVVRLKDVVKPVGHSVPKGRRNCFQFGNTWTCTSDGIKCKPKC